MLRALVGLTAAILSCAVWSCGASATILYGYRSACISGCNNIGLLPGSPVGGVIGFQDNLVKPNATISTGELFAPGAVTQFGFGFGDQGVGGPSDRVPIDASVTFNSTTSAAVAFVIDAGSTAQEGTEAVISPTNWAVLVPLVPFGPVLGGPGTLTRITPIDEPAGAMVLASALVGLVVLRRRG